MIIDCEGDNVIGFDVVIDGVGDWNELIGFDGIDDIICCDVGC